MGSNIDVTDLIYDSFAYNNSYIVVLNNKDNFDPEFGDLLLLGKIEHTERGNRVVPVEGEEYDDIAQYYVSLRSAFLKDEEDE